MTFLETILIIHVIIFDCIFFIYFITYRLEQFRLNKIRYDIDKIIGKRLSKVENSVGELKRELIK